MTDSSKDAYYQSIKKYDGSEPTYFQEFIAAVEDHYATWTNGEKIQGIWAEHFMEGGVCLAAPDGGDGDEAYLQKFAPHLRIDVVDPNDPVNSLSKFLSLQRQKTQKPVSYLTWIDL